MQGYRERARVNLLPLSAEQSRLDLAIKEWRYEGKCRALEPRSGTCELCEQKELSYHFEIINPGTRKTLNVGSECIKTFMVPVVDEGGHRLSQADADLKVDRDRRELEERVRHARVKRLLGQIVAAADSDKWKQFFEGILGRYIERKKLTPKEALPVLKRAKSLGLPFSPQDISIELRRDKSKSDLGGLDDWELRILWKCLRPDQRSKLSEYQRRAEAD